MESNLGFEEFGTLEIGNNLKEHIEGGMAMGDQESWVYQLGLMTSRLRPRML